MTLRLTTYEAETYDGVFPGITPDESALLSAFFSQLSDRIFGVQIDVFIGPGDTSASGFGATFDRMWAAITRKRIDAVVDTLDETWVVEAKVHAHMRAVTQVRKYVELYRHDSPCPRLVRPVLVCRSHDPGVDVALGLAGGIIFRFPSDANRWSSTR